MIKIYGIKNCNTMKNAFLWLDKNKIEYSFHDYKKLSLEAETIKEWMKKNPIDQLINTKGTTWKQQTDKDKKSISDPQKAIALMIKNTSMIKRPLVEAGKGNYLLGFNEEEWKKVLKK